MCYQYAAKSLQSCMTLCNPIDGSPPGSPVPGILQARTLEWVAVSFSNAWKWKVKVKLLSRVRLLATPWTAAYQAPQSMGVSRQKYWSGCHCLLWLSVYLNPVFQWKWPLHFRSKLQISDVVSHIANCEHISLFSLQSAGLGFSHCSWSMLCLLSPHTPQLPFIMTKVEDTSVSTFVLT